MADKIITYLSSDWKIWTYQPVENRFILDFTALNDATKPLSATDGEVKVLDVEIGSINIQEGAEITNGVFTDVQPASADISLIFKDFTQTDSMKFLIGTALWITFRNGETYEDTVYKHNTPIFIGRIRSFNVNLQPESDYASITVQATSGTQDDLNVQLTILKDNIVYKTAAIGQAAYLNNIPYLYKDSYLHFGGTALGAYETKTYGEWVRDMNLCDLYVIRDDVTPIELNYGATTRTYKYQTGIKTSESVISSLPEYDFTGDNVSGLVMNFDGEGAPTGVSLVNYYNSAIVYDYGTPAIASSGQAYNFGATIDVKDLNEMLTVSQKMLSKTKSFSPVEVTVKTATNYQNLTIREETLLDQTLTPRQVYLYPKSLLRIGDVANVNIPEFGIDNQQVFIVGRNIEISPDNWLTTYNLWKGLFT